MTRFSWLTRMAAAAIVCGSVAACSPSGYETDGAAGTTGTSGTRADIEITAGDYRFDPKEVTASPGQELRVELVNKGSHPHSIEFHLEGGAEAELESEVAAGDSGTLSVTAPATPGRYVFYCPVGDHRSRGMEGTLVVQAR